MSSRAKNNPSQQAIVGNMPLSLRELFLSLSRLRTRQVFQNELDQRLGALLRVSAVAVEIESRGSDRDEHDLADKNRVRIPLQFTDGDCEFVIFFGIPGLSRESRQSLYQTMEAVLSDLLKIALRSGTAALNRFRKEHSLTPYARTRVSGKRPLGSISERTEIDDFAFVESSSGFQEQETEAESSNLRDGNTAVNRVSSKDVADNSIDREPPWESHSFDSLQSFVHRLRNSLTAILSGSDQLLVSDQTPYHPEDLALLEMVEKAGKLQQDLIDRYLKLHSPLKLSIKTCKLHETLESLIAEYDTKRCRKTEIGVSSGDIRITLDSSLLSQIITELLDNAYESGETEPVSVRWNVVNGRAVVLIKNSIKSGNEEFQDKFFQPFFTSKQDHSGLGLAIARRYARVLGGTVNGVSLRGTAVVALTLPITRKEPVIQVERTTPCLQS